MIREARSADLQRMQDIEVAAGGAFREIGMAAIAEDRPPALDTLKTYQLAGRSLGGN